MTARLPAALVALAAVSLTAAAEPTPPAWVDEGEALGLVEMVASPMVPATLDLDQDGQPELFWWSHLGVTALHVTGDGLALVDVEVPSTLQPVDGGPDPVLVVLDADGDGQDDLLLIAEEISLLKVSGPYALTGLAIPFPGLPGATILDAAAGDLNGDGRPDIVLAAGVFGVDRIEQIGHPDLVLMNLGEGRFELQRLAPVRDGFTNGVTLADMNGDGRLDVIESMDFSPRYGPSRILLNMTPPGAATPTFQPSPDGFDTGTYGMGVAAEDVDGDGDVDLYNTSLGLDQLSLGRPDGGFDDGTFTQGIVHEWGETSMRIQWAPSFADLNGDGLVDILVRHGGRGSAAIQGMTWTIAYSEADLVYVQRQDGGFVRTPVPFTYGVGTQGRQALVFDVNDDGLPDVALGGPAGSAGLWRNATEIPDETRRLTLRLLSTVSPSPATGARVVASCDGSSLTRLITSGGKMGAMAVPETHLAFPGCAEQPVLAVHWPSGAISVHEVTPGASLVVATEPLWWTPDPSEPGSLLVDPVLGGAARACVGDATTILCCDVSEAPCTLPVPDGEGVPSVWIEGAEPMALPNAEPRWSLVVEPTPARPGEPVTFHVLHVGDEASFDPSAVSLFVDSQYVGWSATDGELRMLSADFAVPADATTLDLSLFPIHIAPDPTWTVKTGAGVDPDWAQVAAYPYRILGGITEFWSWAAFLVHARDRDKADVGSQVALTAPDGTVLDTAENFPTVSLARLRLLATWESLEGLDEVVLRDLGGGYAVTLPVPEPIAISEAAGHVAGVYGWLSRNRLVEGGDASPLFLLLHDADGHVMPPEPELVTVEADGAEVVIAPDLFPGGGYNLYAVVRTTPGLGPGEVRVRAADGRLLGSWAFTRRPKGGGGADLALSTATLSPTEDPAHLAATHAVHVDARNRFDEGLGGQAHIGLTIRDGTEIEAAVSVPEGGQQALVAADPLGDILEVDVYVDGEFLVTLTALIEAAATGEIEGADQAPLAEPVDGGASSEDTGQDTGAPPGDGCACESAPPPPWPLLAVLLMLLASARRPRRLE